MAAFAYANGRYGSVEAGIAALRGHHIFTPKRVISIGAIAPSAEVEFQFPVRNLTSHAISVVGINSSCSCLTAKHNVPFDIAVVPGGVHYLSRLTDESS